jgi:calcium uptake protein 1, mitochondrial
MAAALARASRLRSAVGRLGCPRAFFASSASREAEASGRGARAFASVAALAAGSGLGVWMLASKPQPLVADAGSGDFSATFGGAGTMEEKRRFLFGGELRWFRFIRVAVPIVAVFCRVAFAL